VLQSFTDHKVLDYMFNTIKSIALSNDPVKDPIKKSTAEQGNNNL
ncbi:MAG: hypothetical protein ACI971_001336, partial [Colwellia sp.]